MPNATEDTQSGLFVTQIGYSTAETFAARMYGKFKPSTFENLRNILEHDYIPVGTVKFCEEVMRIQGIRFPNFSTYPVCLKPYLKRNLAASNVGIIKGSLRPMFVKPIATKLFTGFVWPEEGEDMNLLLGLPDSTMLWCSDVVNFVSEWRYYVINGSIVGQGRYDDGMDTTPEPDITVVQKAADDFQNADAPAGYSLDFGVLDSGETVLVEANDGWALGLYPRGTCSPRDYLRLLDIRWAELRKINV